MACFPPAFAPADLAHEPSRQVASLPRCAVLRPCWPIAPAVAPTHAIERVALRFHLMLPEFVWDASAMKAFKHIFTAILACVTFAALAESAKLELVLLQAIPSDAVDGRIVQLQTLGSSGCRYVGALESATRTVDGLGDKIVGAAISNTDRFIKVTRKECGGLVEATSLLIPLGRMKPGPDAGARLTVLVAK